MNEKSENIKIYRCNICNKIYVSNSSLCNHNSKFHKNNIVIKKSKDVINLPKKVINSSKDVLSLAIQKDILKCTICSKTFQNKSNRYRHEKTCKTKLKVDKCLEIDKINAEKEKIQEEKELIKLKIKLQSGLRLNTKTFKSLNKMLMNRSYYNNINSNNTTINNNIQNNINLIGFGKEEILKILTLKDKKLIMNSGFLCLEKIVEIANVDSYNEFKNILITNLKDNFAYKYDDNFGYFVVVNKNDTINELICNRVMDIEAIYDQLETANKIDDKTKNIIERFLTKIEDKNKFVDKQENITYTNYKDYKMHNIKILLYNNHDKITKDISLFISH